MTENERLLNQPRVPSDYNHLKHKLSSLQKELATTRTYAGEIERKHMALLNSRTWQATESVRRVARFVKRRKRPAPFVPRFVNGKDAKVIDGGNVTSSDADGLSKLPVSDMVKKLWGGFSESAKTELTLVSNSANVGRSDKVEASWNLARWEAASGNWQTCLDHLSRIAKLDKSFHQSMRGRVLSFEALIRSGNGAQAIEDANAALSKEINGNFLCAISNALLVQEGAESGSDKRLNRLNEMYADAGIASFSLKDPAHGLVFGNITANAPNSENGMLVSVLVPVFNASDFIEAAIESLLKQTHRNLEVIAVDDASTDDSWEKLEKLAASDARLKISRNDQNLGAYPTRNHALANATGDVITVHDSDDWSHPQMIELQLKALLDNPGLKATFSMMARVLPTMEFLLRPERNNLEYVHMSYPSLMMRREDLEQLDKWDGVFANADDEFVQRLRAKWGKQATKQILPTTPLSFFLRHEQSLTEMKGTHLKSLTFGIRKEYADQARFWRESVFPDKGTQKHADMERRDLKTPFPIPSGLAPRNWARDPVYDLVIISDLSLLGGTRRCNEGYVAAATELGLRVGLFHWPRYDLVLSPVADEYRLLSYQRNVDILVHEDNITCDTVLIHHPPILKHRLDSVPKITARQVGILVNQLPMQRRSQDPHYYFPDDVGELTQDLFGVDPLWIPISALARRMLKEIGGFERIAGTDWLPPLGQTLPPMATFDLSYVGAKRKIVLGRHSRDHPTKWPENAQALKQAYCADTDIAVRLMGGVRTPKTLLGKLPSNWTTLDFDAEPIDSFLSGLDFFVHYVSDDYIEEFGRNAMEAMAVGVPVILPPVFKETFGEAAIYSAPQKVHDTIRALWAEPDLYRAKVQAAYDFVLNTSDQRAVQKRLGGFVQRKTDPAKWADTIIAAE
ncbi:MAG: glycosyltransferase [Pseudomonadota bacterium]